MPELNNPWQTVDSRIIHQSHGLTLYEDDVITPNGRPGLYTYIQSPPFVLTLAYDGEHFILVRQYRYPLKKVMTELPGGSIDEGEGPLEAAKREFEEETGLIANKWTVLGMIDNPNPATLFLAENLIETGNHKMDEDGIAEVVRLTWAGIDEAIKRGDFTDSKTMAALLLFERYRASSV